MANNTKKLTDEHVIMAIQLQSLGYSLNDIKQKLAGMGVDISTQAIGQRVNRFLEKDDAKLKMYKKRLPKPEDLTPDAYVNWFKVLLETILLEAMGDNDKREIKATIPVFLSVIKLEMELKGKTVDDSDMKDLLKNLSKKEKSLNTN